MAHYLLASDRRVSGHLNTVSAHNTHRTNTAAMVLAERYNKQHVKITKLVYNKIINANNQSPKSKLNDCVQKETNIHDYSIKCQHLFQLKKQQSDKKVWKMILFFKFITTFILIN